MAKPVTPQDMFDLWQKMVNPGAYPLQSLMFPVLDAKELEKKIAELETVQHWLKANLNMLQLSIKSLEYQREMVRGGERMREAMSEGEPAPGGDEIPNPAMWAWNMMAQAGSEAAEAMGRAVEAAGEAAAGSARESAREPAAPGPKARKARKARRKP
jgi:hypothetical protein